MGARWTVGGALRVGALGCCAARLASGCSLTMLDPIECVESDPTEGYPGDNVAPNLIEP